VTMQRILIIGSGGAGKSTLARQLAERLALPLIGQDGERYIAHALPLTSGTRRRAGIIYTAVAALFVRKAALAMSSRSEVIGKVFKLTPTELRVLKWAAFPKWSRHSALPIPRSGRMSAACLRRPAPRDRLIWSSSSRDMRRRWKVDGDK